MDIELQRLLFPQGLLDIFIVTSYELTDTGYVFFLDERLVPPEGYGRSELESKGFVESVSIADFPLRGKPCCYKVRRRRWLVKKTGKYISRNWSIVAKGTRTTEEFASFLKGLDR